MATKKKARVIRAYTDRIDDSLHLVGDEVELTDARLTELQDGGFVIAVEAEPPKTLSKRRK